MVKFVVVIARRTDLTQTQFLEYFHDVHGPLRRRIPGLCDYRQSHRSGDRDREPPPWDVTASSISTITRRCKQDGHLPRVSQLPQMSPCLLMSTRRAGRLSERSGLSTHL